nr:sigma-70 family RNA polymerase sigma factor [Paraglaciecola sp. G1-23]
MLRASQFGQLFEADKKRLYAYIHAFVSDHTIAEDIFQETSLILWQEFDKFEIGSKFSKWANVIAFYRINHHRNANKKYQLGLSDDFLQEFSQNISIIESNTNTQEQKWQDLEHCCALLSEPLRKVYQSFYIENLTAQDIATNTGRSLIAIRKVVHKVRKRLFDCIEQKKQGAS